MSRPASPLSPPPEGGHRERLLAAMAEAIRAHDGFAPVTVADVVRRARTSRRTFYEHFDDREDCFLALFDVVSDGLLAAIAHGASADAPWEARVERALAAYLDAVAAEPAVARACIQEVPALGPRGTTRAWRTSERWAQQIVGLIDEARADDPGLRSIPVEVATVITGGLRDLVAATLEQGRDPTALQPVAADLIRRLVAR